MIYLIILAVLLFFGIKLYLKVKRPKLNSMVLVTGSIKTGKSTLSVFFVLREYRKRLFLWKIKHIFNKNIEKPLIYSNVPLGVPYVPLTNELLARKERFNYKSVIYVCESSLVSDSQLIKDNNLNLDLLLFNKLIGHESKGGIIIYDTQCIGDNHYSIKRSLSQYFYIHHTRKIPFFLLCYVREMIYSDDDSTLNVFNEDIEKTLKVILVPKRVWKYFDCYCYSSLTDNLPVANNVVNKKDLKCNDIVSFNPRIKERFKK